MNVKVLYLALALLVFTASCKTAKNLSMKSGNKTVIAESKQNVVKIINAVNSHWQETHPEPGIAFWNVAAYHTGNMEAYKITKKESVSGLFFGLGGKKPMDGSKVSK